MSLINLKRIEEMFNEAGEQRGGKHGWRFLEGNYFIGSGLDPNESPIAENAKHARSFKVHQSVGETIRPWFAAVLDKAAGISFQDNTNLNGKQVTVGYPPSSDVLTIYGQFSGYEATGGKTLAELEVLDAAYTPSGRIQDFMVTASNPESTSVFVNPGWYDTPTGLRTYFGGDDASLSTELSALTSGQHQMAVVCFNPSTAAFVIVTNTAVAGTNKGDFDQATIAELTIDPRYILCGAVHLVYNETTLSEDDIYRGVSDPRSVLSRPAVIASSSTFTQTYSTASFTHANPTASTINVTSTNATPWGYSSQAEADAIETAINALIADNLNIKQVLNAIIDVLQAMKAAN